MVLDTKNAPLQHVFRVCGIWQRGDGAGMLWVRHVLVKQKKKEKKRAYLVRPAVCPLLALPGRPSCVLARSLRLTRCRRGFASWWCRFGWRSRFDASCVMVVVVVVVLCCRFVCDVAFGEWRVGVVVVVVSFRMAVVFARVVVVVWWWWKEVVVVKRGGGGGGERGGRWCRYVIA